MTRILPLLLCAAVLPLCASEADREALANHFARRDGKPWIWVFYGDSITMGARHTQGWRDFTEIFSERVRWELGFRMDCVINAGNSGQTSVHLLDPEQYEWQVRRHRPDVVVLMVGMNDMVSDWPAEVFRQNLQKLVARIRADGAIPVLQTCNTIQLVENPDSDYLKGYVTRYHRMPEYMDIVREVAAEADLLLVDNHRYWTDHADLDAWLAEPIHPGATGHREIAGELCRTLGIYAADSDALSPAGAGED